MLTLWCKQYLQVPIIYQQLQVLQREDEGQSCTFKPMSALLLQGVWTPLPTAPVVEGVSTGQVNVLPLRPPCLALADPHTAPGAAPFHGPLPLGLE